MMKVEDYSSFIGSKPNQAPVATNRLDPALDHINFYQAKVKKVLRMLTEAEATMPSNLSLGKIRVELQKLPVAPNKGMAL